MTAIAVPIFDVRLTDRDIAVVEETLRSGWLTMGPRTQEFERAFADSLGVRHAVATSSCTSALHLAFLGAGVGPGDEVIVPAITLVATAAVARYVMPAVLDEGIDRDRVRTQMIERHGVQTTVLYPAIHELTAYAAAADRLPRAEAVARRQLTLPLFPHMDEAQQDVVVQALAEALVV